MGLIQDPRLADLIRLAGESGWDIVDDGGSVVFEGAHNVVVRRQGDGLVMFGSVSYPDEPLYLSDDYPFDGELAARFLGGEAWVL